jgi:isoquinoline 1-oxidoreductase
MTWDRFRPAALVDVRCGIGPDGSLLAWDCDLFNCGPRGAQFLYATPNLRLRSYRCASPLPQGPWRGNGAQANTFAREVHLDHVASELSEDPVAYRLRHLAPDSRLARAIEAAASAYRWSPHVSPTGHGVGFACASDGGSVVAEIAEVEVERASGQIRVRRVVVAQESGVVVNPDGLRNQIEGGVVMGLGPTLHEAVRYEGGRCLSRSFASYPIPTFLDAPSVDITLVPNPDLPPQSGGNAALCAVAPAVANAVFDATGQRLRDLPLGRVRTGA